MLPREKGRHAEKNRHRNGNSPPPKQNPSHPAAALRPTIVPAIDQAQLGQGHGGRGHAKPYPAGGWETRGETKFDAPE